MSLTAEVVLSEGKDLFGFDESGGTGSGWESVSRGIRV